MTGDPLFGLNLVAPNTDDLPEAVTTDLPGPPDNCGCHDCEKLDGVVVDPADARDSRHIRRISAANEDLVVAHARLRASVAIARRAGDTWDAIGVALGVTRQAAQQRFKDVV